MNWDEIKDCRKGDLLAMTLLLDNNQKVKVYATFEDAHDDRMLITYACIINELGDFYFFKIKSIPVTFNVKVRHMDKRQAAAYHELKDGIFKLTAIQ